MGNSFCLAEVESQEASRLVYRAACILRPRPRRLRFLEFQEEQSELRSPRTHIKYEHPHTLLGRISARKRS